MLKIVHIETISKIFGKSEDTIRKDLTRKPYSLPPPVRMKGSREILWLEDTVDEFLMKNEQKPAGRPRNIPSKSRQVP